MGAYSPLIFALSLMAPRTTKPLSAFPCAARGMCPVRSMSRRAFSMAMSLFTARRRVFRTCSAFAMKARYALERFA